MNKHHKKQNMPSEQELLNHICKQYGVSSPDQLVKTILHPDVKDFNRLVDSTKAFVQKIAKKISTSQLRNIFARVKSAHSPRDLYKLRPLLAYAAGRSSRHEEREALTELVVLMDTVIKHVQNENDVARFQEFAESIVAYHRYFNPREN